MTIKKKFGFELVILNVFILISVFGNILCNKVEDYHNEYTREWAVKISDPLMADLIALETGFQNKGLVRFFKTQILIIQSL